MVYVLIYYIIIGSFVECTLATCYSSEDSRYQYINDISCNGYKYTECTNVTLETVISHQYQQSCYHNWHCWKLSVKDPHIIVLNNKIFPICNHLDYSEVILSNNSIRTLDESTFYRPYRNSNDIRIQCLKLDHNELTFLHASNFNTSNLQILDLSFNKLTSLGNATYRLPSLKEFYLNNNNIKEIQNNIFQNLGSLEILNISNNLLENLESAFVKSLKSLKSLDLNNNRLESLESSSFTDLQSLIYLDISHNNLKNISVDTFMGLNNLEVLNLTNNRISSLNYRPFLTLNNLQHLLLTQNNIQTVPLGVFQNFQDLENLQLGNNHLTDFKTGTFSNLYGLKYLNLSNNRFSKINERVLFPLQSLVLVDLSNNYLSDLNYSSLLMHLPTLQGININNNNWTCSFLTAMLKYFRSRKIFYAYTSNTNFEEENVYGIACKEYLKRNGDAPSISTTNITSQFPNMNIELLRNVINVLKEMKQQNNNIEEMRDDVKSIASFMVGQGLNKNISYENNNNDNSGNVTSVITVILLLCILILLSYKIVLKNTKICHRNKNRIFSEIELADNKIL